MLIQSSIIKWNFKKFIIGGRTFAILKIGIIFVKKDTIVFQDIFTHSCPVNKMKYFIGPYILYVPPILQQIQISVDQPYAGPAASCCGINGTHSICAYGRFCPKYKGPGAAVGSIFIASKKSTGKFIGIKVTKIGP
jgi:hypothetical protein